MKTATKSAKKKTTSKHAKLRKKGKFANTVERYWDGIPVQDATKDLRVIIKPCDITNAEQKDPGHCVFARACKRSFGTKKVLFLRKVAYVELPDEKGKTKVERFLMSPSVHQLISDFDRGNKIIPHGGFLLLAPSASQQLDVGRAKDEARRKRVKEALLRGERVGPSNRPKEAPHSPKMIDFEVRSGTGLVHFSK
jgi:hypothetical protein